MNQISSKILNASPQLLARIIEIGGKSNKEASRWSFTADRQNECPAFDPGRWRKRWTGKSTVRIALWD